MEFQAATTNKKCLGVVELLPNGVMSLPYGRVMVTGEVSIG
jgi:hypothetical protein